MRDNECAVYRHFDKDGELLYVGISQSFVIRTGNHKNHSHWYRQITRIEIEWCPSREAAVLAEEWAIHNEKPKFNGTGPNANRKKPTKYLPLGIEVKRMVVLREASKLGIKLNEASCLAALQLELYEAKKLLKRAS